MTGGVEIALSAEEKHQVIDWLINGRVGQSSKSMAAMALGVKDDVVREPGDPDDLSRCIMLLDWAPGVRKVFHEIAKLSPYWRELIDDWGRIEMSYRKEYPNHRGYTEGESVTYLLMRKAREAAQNKKS